jgi:ABC-type phosphate transport system ATPase subunit
MLHVLRCFEQHRLTIVVAVSVAMEMILMGHPTMALVLTSVRIWKRCGR